MIAIDSSCFKAWANSFSKRADPDAATGKSATKGWFFGYKAHLTIDAQSEIPVALIVTPGNGYDGHQLHSLRDKVMRNLSGHIQVVTADKGYDAGYNYLDISESFQALPIIPKRGETNPPRLRQLSLDNFLVIPEPINPATSPRDVKKRAQYYRHSPPLPRDDPWWSASYTTFSG